ncbi:DUF4276 family protein [Pseudonocardia nigra]|uniref:DUF4276 family protein n=1 Tax=Pseudonocardia nigra TaxID=1921578 RepID=UPI001C5D52A5|nr:DUF4276 family protein [Pseudonocardia nigra]
MTPLPTQPHIGLIVEGPGDKNGVPVLFRRHLQDVGEYRDILGKPIPANGRGSITTPKGIEGYVSVAASRPGCRGILVVIDSDDDPVCELGPALLPRAQAVSKVPVYIALAERCYESWLFASAETLELGLTYDEAAHAQFAIKSGLHPTKYVKPVWQPKLSHRVDIGLACGRSPSLARALVKLDELVLRVVSDFTMAG